MQLRCPNCNIALDVVGDSPLSDVSCPSCGTALNTLPEGDDTASFSLGARTSIAHFEMLELLGQGTFGLVWKARDTKLHRLVAIKVPRSGQFDPATFIQFAREAQAAAQIQHPNIVSVFEVGRVDSLVYIVSEFINGVPLRTQMVNRREPPREAAELTATLAEAVHVAHQAGIVHRDLKPGNILIDGDGQPHITDFGLAKRDSAEVTLTVAGQVLGTAAYMSPEQAKGDSHKADRRSDIYSLGVILYELLCGKRPFIASESRQLLYQVQFAEPVALRKRNPEIPRDLETICLKAMRKEPEQRYATAQEFADDLHRYLRGEPIQARPVSYFEHSWRWCRRNPAIASSLSVAAMALAALVISFAIPRHVAPLSPAPAQKKISLATAPPGASIVFHPLDPQTGEPQPQRSITATGVTPITLDLTPGDYLVVAVGADGSSFHEVYRRVPGEHTPGASYPHLRWQTSADGIVILPEIEIPPADVAEGMVKFAGASAFVVGSEADSIVPPHQRTVPGFLLDPLEMSIDDFNTQRIANTIFHFYQQNSVEPDRVEPIAFVSWNDAVRTAEALGKRLPDEFEYEFAATLGGTRRYPWGDTSENIVDWRVRPVGQPDWDQLPTSPPVFGLFSNVAEWTSSWPLLYPAHRSAGLNQNGDFSEERIVRGGIASLLNSRVDEADFQDADPRRRLSIPIKTWNRNIGFRCARSLKPRLKPEDFGRELP